MKHLFLVLGAAVLAAGLSACRTTGPAAAVGEARLGEVWIREIRAKIDEGRLADAYQDVSYLDRHPEKQVAPEATEELRALIAERLQGEFSARVAEGDYQAGLPLYRSIRAIGESERLPEWSAAELIYRVAEARGRAGESPLALALALRALRAEPSAELRVRILRLMLTLAAELGSPALQTRSLAALEKAGAEPAPEERTEIVPAPPVAQMVRGTVTIWVNRGIKIEKGVGFPDRVIGSGFFIDRRGYLLTNYHVVSSEVDPKYEGYSRLYIRPSDKSEQRIPAKVVGFDRIFDLALIKAEIEPPFVFSYSGEPELKVGDTILAIGSPAGLENTVTSGIVSAAGRRFLQMGDTMQVDVPINYGNSGGPLLDAEGQLVGIVFAGIEQFEGVNFAIPFDWVVNVLPRLFAGGESAHPWLGLALQETAKGLEVTYALPDSPAERAGLQRGDLLLALDGKPYQRIGVLQAALLDLDYPSLVRVEWSREGEAQSGLISLAQRPFSPIEDALEKDRRENLLYPLFGMELEKTNRFLWKTNYVIRRVLPGSIADESGLSPDDPLNIQGWQVDEDNRVAVLQIYVKKKKSGFLESIIQIGAYLETDKIV